MKNSVWDQSFCIDSEEDEEVKHIKDEDDEADSDSSSYSYDDEQQSKPNSLCNAWPQSFRQSIDLYGSLQSPTLNFLGTSALSQYGSSLLSSSLTGIHTSEILPSYGNPLIPKDNGPQQRSGSHSLLPPVPSRTSLRKVTTDQISKDVHQLPASGKSSFSQSVLNGINILCGVAILSTPYAVQQGGWAGLPVLLIFGILSFYTGLLLRKCLDSQPGLETYPDIGQAAFGTVGRAVISIILYVELYASAVGYIISMSDNLSSLFPHAHLSLAGFELYSHHLFAFLTTLAVLPTVWLRDLSVLSYISVGGVVASILLALCLIWIGVVDDVGFKAKGTSLNLSTLPVALGLYGFCFGGHAVFPNLYTSMEKRNQFPLVLLTSFGFSMVLYAGVAVVGYLMFGELTESQFTLNMPINLAASKISIWTTNKKIMLSLIRSTYALTMSPVAMSLEELIPSSYPNYHMYSIFIRTSLVVSTLLVGLTIPFFGLLLSLIGSSVTMLVTFILPCICFLRIWMLCVLITTVGTISAAFGSYSAIANIIEELL
ncbi:hypothetical protein DCAR_0521851 [Daucus carota subsp. sativus]|uniref:Amino acid transporter transmembrane domain-containing protein n=1 Tax=Daucus carota subsp. sativus TaxID=79200 RepID=A0AAF0X8L0_DAUCS|nr:hypothetical protein DCAR_0521851 [Daucus carota subsp. sativus]